MRLSSTATRSSPRTPCPSNDNEGTAGETATTLDDPLSESQVTISSASDNAPSIPALSLNNVMPDPQDSLSTSPAALDPGRAAQQEAPSTPTPTGSGSPNTTRTRQKQPSSRTQSVQLQADVTALSSIQATVDEAVTRNAVLCGKLRLEDRAAVENRFKASSVELQVVRDEVLRIKNDIAALNADAVRPGGQHHGPVSDLQSELQSATERLNNHDTDLQAHLGEFKRLTEEIDRIDDSVNDRFSRRSNILQDCLTSISELTSEFRAEQTFRRSAQENVKSILSRLDTIEKILPAALAASYLTPDFRQHSQADEGKGKQRASISSVYSADATSPEDQSAISAGVDEDPQGDLGDWAEGAFTPSGQPGPSSSKKRPVSPNPDEHTVTAKRAKADQATRVRSTQASARASTLTSGPSPSVDPSTSRPSPSSLPSLDPAFTQVPSSASPLQQAVFPVAFPEADPDLRPEEALERNITRVVMENLDGFECFSTSDKLANYNAYRQINFHLRSHHCPTLTSEPCANSLLSTTATQFTFRDATETHAVLASWNARPLALRNLRIYEDTSGSLPAPTTRSNLSQVSPLRSILAIEVPSSSRGRAYPRGSYRSRGSSSGRGTRGRGGWY